MLKMCSDNPVLAFYFIQTPKGAGPKQLKSVPPALTALKFLFG